MTLALERLLKLDGQRLHGMRRGVEKESLRARPDGHLATSPHPRSLGSALTHPTITTDFCESQVELVTGAHLSPEACLEELQTLHQQVAHALAAQGDERLWVSSMPCALPDQDEDIPLGQYGSSHIGRAKTVYRRGLGYRYGRRMQTISGIHYNWSLPGLDNAAYFGLIRNFRRHSFLLLLLFGASPAVCRCFVPPQGHGLSPLGQHSLFLPHATSLRMGRLGYQSDAQAALSVSYNHLEGYAAALEEAMTRIYPPYQAIGLQDEQGGYRQLSTTLLQIENEFYGTIRPKRPIHPGERPLHALRQRGVEYVEVRCMDLDPFEPLGLSVQTMRFLDVFLLHCLLSDSPPDTPAEIAAIGRNQHLTAARGREAGLCLERAGKSVPIQTWAAELLAECLPLARHLDEVLDPAGTRYTQAVEDAAARLRQPQDLPSARVLAAIDATDEGEFLAFVRERAASVHEQLLRQPWSTAQQTAAAQQASESLRTQHNLESGTGQDFEAFRQHYLDSARLRPS